MKGQVQLVDIHSPSLEGNPLSDPATRSTPIYLPPGYGAGQRYPVVYFLHGFTGSARSWLNVSAFTPNVPERIDRLIDSGAVPPFIGVFVDGWTAIGGSQWIDSEAIGSYHAYVVKDVVAFVDQKLRTVPSAAGRAIVGKSSGGYGALVFGWTSPHVFAHVGCHSGDAAFEYCYLPHFPKAAGTLAKAGGVEPWFCEFIRRAGETKAKGDDFDVINVVAMAAAYSPNRSAPMGIELPFDLHTARIRPEVWNRWLEHDPVRFVPRHLDAYRKLKTLFLDCGSRDEFHLQYGARMVLEELKRGGVEVAYEEFDDGHMNINYRYDRSILHIVPRLDRS